MMVAISTTLTFEVISCSSCSVRFGLPSDFETRRREDHATFYCPNGHSQHFPAKSEAERLRDQLKATEAKLEQERKAKDAAQAEAKRITKRVCAGTCPHCHRTVQQLARHVKTKHPEALK